MRILLFILKRSIINRKNISTETAECQDYDKVLDDETAFTIGTTKMTTNYTVKN